MAIHLIDVYCLQGNGSNLFDGSTTLIDTKYNGTQQINRKCIRLELWEQRQIQRNVQRQDRQILPFLFYSYHELLSEIKRLFQC